MPWQTPSLPDLRALVRDQISAALGVAAIIPNSPLRVTADNQAVLAHLCLIYLDHQSKQLLPDTADSEALDRHARIWLSEGGRRAPEYAAGTLVVTGTPGALLPAGTLLSTGDGDDEVAYQTTAAVVLAGSSTSVPVQAIDPG